MEGPGKIGWWKLMPPMNRIWVGVRGGICTGSGRITMGIRYSQ